MLSIAQITDLHIMSDNNRETTQRNDARLRQTLKAIDALKPRPIAIVASGDLVDRGAPEEYVELKSVLRDAAIPLYLGIGNHDSREAFRAAFPETPVDANGFVQYAIDFGALRLVMCDSVDAGRDGGAFCVARAAWLSDILDAEPRTPTIVVLHHPPIASGIQWMDPASGEDWIARLANVLDGRKQVQAVVCGHVHRAFHGAFAGKLVSISPATAPQLTLDMTDVDRRVPDGREIVREEPPGFSLYSWDGFALTTHICVAGDFATVANFDAPFDRD